MVKTYKIINDKPIKILSKEELTLEDIKEFCKTQCEIIEGKWRNYD